mmetsp:Transcript_25881/g.26096  ORF Transcript_25881/g.26096 Transcript_25881/m.26096 type:complete len:417 (+) Transcript_25881:88-1338(+)
MNPNCTHHVKTNDHISISVSNIASPKDEDRFCENLSDQELPSLSSFGVFDGHNGKEASAYCAKTLHNSIAQYYLRLLEIAEEDDTIAKHNLLKEELLCESIRSQYEKADTEIKAANIAGTTSTSLFLLEENDGTYRAFCSWVGDSRCILLSRKINDEDGKYEITRYQSFLMSEDHKPDLPRERLRIEKKIEPIWNGRPVDVTIETFRGHEGCDYSVHSESLLKRSLPQLKELELKSTILKSETDSTDSDNEQFNSVVPIVSTPEPDNDAQIIHSESFIGERVLKGYTDIKGPVAVCGRYGVSLNMSRSIGDKYGPRRCIATPDITSITIYPNQHARFILASDGLWDVITVERIEEIIRRYPNARKLSSKLSKMAWLERINRCMRMDDITAMVVDVNYHLAESAIAATSVKCNCNIS